jgi:hypothetical protein
VFPGRLGARCLGPLSPRRQHPGQQGPALPHERTGASTSGWIRWTTFVASAALGGSRLMYVSPPVHQPPQLVARQLGRRCC